MDTQNVDKSAFSTIYDTYVQKVYQVAYHYSNDHHAAQDVTQTVFMKLYIHMENVNVNNIEAWLMVTTKHIVLDEVIRCARNKKDTYRADVGVLIDKKIYLDSLEDTYLEGYEKEKRAEFVEEIYTELYSKNPQWFEALTTTYILEKPQKKVAKEMGISLGSLQLMLHRTKNWIRKTYQKKFEDLDKA